jgi:flagellar biosynthesis protein FliQ
MAAAVIWLANLLIGALVVGLLIALLVARERYKRRTPRNPH